MAEKVSYKISHPLTDLEEMAKINQCNMLSTEFAKHLDEQDALRDFRHEFFLPKMKDLPKADCSLVDPRSDCLYFAANSLGLCPKRTRDSIDEELSKWTKIGSYGYTDHTTGLPWATCDEELELDMAALVGAVPGEIAIMNSLSVNLHLLLTSFYRPTPQRHKILCESKAFPSNHYAYQSHISLHGYDPNTSLLCVEPHEGEMTIRTDEIITMIEKEGESIAVVCFGGANFLTGQVLDMQAITQAGHAKGCYVGFDVAHAVGNLPIRLHDWKVDFACWCTYKYINASAGGIGCMFLHKSHEQNEFPKFLGWWGQKIDSRFMMDNTMNLLPGARGYRITNPSPLLCASLRASLQVFNQTTISEIRSKSKLMIAYMEYLILQLNESITSKPSSPAIIIITPSDPEQRGNQMSLIFPNQDIAVIFEELEKRGVVCSIRQPVMRIAIAPLYNSFEDVHQFMTSLKQALSATNEQSIGPQCSIES